MTQALPLLQTTRLPIVRRVARAVAGMALVMLGLYLAVESANASDPPKGDLSKKESVSGLPLPRFVSLKADKVHVRQGPGTDHKIAWVFQQAGLPVEVIQEFETWRRVRDSEGTMGWVFHAMLSGRRTVLVLPWEAKGGETKDGKTVQAELRASGSASSSAVALIEAGVLANVRSCDGSWCEISVGPHAGHIEQKKLWGVYDKEPVK
jgi:SH3-like domain-containing protein